MNLLFKNTPYKILELFIENPNKEYSNRGIARCLKISHATVIAYIKKLKKLGLINKKTTTLYPVYCANAENKLYKEYKKNQIVFQILSSELVEYIQSQTFPNSIIVFGSCAKGTYNKNSDIDIFVEAENQNLKLAKFEKKLRKNINLLFERNIRDLSENLRHNIINGIVLYGFIKINRKTTNDKRVKLERMP